MILYIDWEGECDVRVSWHTLSKLKSRVFDSRDAAESFAMHKMGKRGSIVSTLDMTPAQLEALKAREAKFREAAKE